MNANSRAHGRIEQNQRLDRRKRATKILQSAINARRAQAPNLD